MHDLERMLSQRKRELDNLEAPGEMADRLSHALKERKPVKRSGSSWTIKVAAICLAILLVGYNFETLAFYGKKLVGYDQVMTGTLRQLNELGKGQLIGKSHSFPNGVSVTLDGIMLDDSQLLAFYTIQDPAGEVDAFHLHPLRIKGFFGSYNMSGGQGELSDDNKTIKWVTSFEPPFFLERTLHLNMAYTDHNTLQEGEISFKLDRAKAMGSTLRKDINQTIELEYTKVKVESILASPTRTVISGSIQHFHELAMGQIKGERLRPNYLSLRLIANDGEVIAQQGGGMSTDMRGIRFEQSFDALPADLQSLHLKLDSISVNRDVSAEVELQKGLPNRGVEILGQQVVLNDVYTANDNTYVTITTDESTVLTRVHLMIDGKKIELQSTVTDSLEKLTDGRILHTRTLNFPGTGENLTLLVERITFTEYYDVTLGIPVH